jgi:hypothetical protein
MSSRSCAALIAIAPFASVDSTSQPVMSSGPPESLVQEAPAAGTCSISGRVDGQLRWRVRDDRGEVLRQM